LILINGMTVEKSLWRTCSNYSDLNTNHWDRWPWQSQLITLWVMSPSTAILYLHN